MLAERLDSVDPEMSDFIRRWFLDREYATGDGEQDWDLVLADWKYMPLLAEYCEDASNPLEKRFEALSALMILDPLLCPDVNNPDFQPKVEKLVLGNPDFARQFSEWMGGTESLEILRLLGEAPPVQSELEREPCTGESELNTSATRLGRAILTILALSISGLVAWLFFR